MTFLPSLQDDAKLLEVFRTYPDTAFPLLDYHEALMRGPSPLSIGDRELIAAYVSGLNACDYCYGVHQVTAEQFGIDEAVLTGVLTDLSTAEVDDRMRPILGYVGKLTRDPGRISPSDARAVLTAGWTERALHDAVSVCALFNFMNRFVSGLGITADDDYSDTSGVRLAEHGYAGLKRLM